MKISQKQISLFTEEASTSSQEDSHVNHIAKLESDLGKRTSDISGRICLEQFKRFNQHSLWGKMFVDLLIGTGEWSSKKCALTWKLVGTKYNRYYCQLVPLVRHTAEIEFGLLPTPTTHQQNTQFKQGGTCLQAKLIQGLLPTPTVFDYNTPRKEETWNKAKERHAAKGVNLQNPLKQMAAMGMLPTPTTRDANGIENSPSQKGKFRLAADLGDGTTSQLNPHFVGEMMGFPENWTTSPFLNGEKNQSKDMEMP